MMLNVHNGDSYEQFLQLLLLFASLSLIHHLLLFSSSQFFILFLLVFSSMQIQWHSRWPWQSAGVHKNGISMQISVFVCARALVENPMEVCTVFVCVLFVIRFVLCAARIARSIQRF